MRQSILSSLADKVQIIEFPMNIKDLEIWIFEVQITLFHISSETIYAKTMINTNPLFYKEATIKIKSSFFIK